MKSIPDHDLYRAACDSGVLIVTKDEEQAAIKFGRAVLALARAELVIDEQAPSPTAGMSIEQRILHVGGRNNAAGYVEFGSTQAVRALVLQVVRDLPKLPVAPSPEMMVDMVPPATSRDRWMYEQGRLAERRVAAPVAPALGSRHPQRTPDQMRELTELEDAAGGVVAAGALAAPVAPSEPVAYLCPAGCGCTWRDNRDGTMSLAGENSSSCDVCEPLPLPDLKPLYTHPAPVAPAGLIDAVRRLVTGFEHVSGIARLWEPDHSSGADRAKLARATEACADVVKLLNAAPVAPASKG